MNTSEEEVFCGAVTSKELEHLYKRKFVPSRKTKSGTFFDSPLNSSDHNIDEEVIGTPHLEAGSSDSQCVPETPFNSVEHADESTGIENSNLQSRNESHSFDEDLTETTIKVKGVKLESAPFYTLPDKNCGSTWEDDGRLASKQLDEGSPVKDSNIHIVTIHGIDESDLDYRPPSELSCTKENMDPEIAEGNYEIGDLGETIGQTLGPAETIPVPEMTEEQLLLLRQLWCSPQEHNAETSSGSPLMNALDLSTSNDKGFLPHSTSSRTSLATLDLSVDERIPVACYLDQIKEENLGSDGVQEHKEWFGNAVVRRPSLHETPANFMSKEATAVNAGFSVSYPADMKIECRSWKTDSKPPLASLVPRYSGIPVARPPVSRPNTHNFKTPNLIHGITTYKSKAPVRGKLFSTPKTTPFKKWNVISPVAQYINEDPVQPLVKIVRSREQRVLPLRPQNDAVSKIQLRNIRPSPEKVPLAHYKLQQTLVHDSVSAFSEERGFRPPRLFPSPYTPKVTKHQGARKGVAEAKINLQLFSQEEPQDLSVGRLNRSTIEAVPLKRTKTLFKKIE